MLRVVNLQIIGLPQVYHAQHTFNIIMLCANHLSTIVQHIYIHLVHPTLNEIILSRESERLSRESERLSRESERLSRESEKLSRESDILSREIEILSHEGDILSRESEILSRERYYFVKARN